MFEKAALTRNQWLNLKQRPTQFGDNKNAPGMNSHIPAPPITEANQKVAPLLIEESDNVPCGEYTEESLNALEGIKHTERPEAFVPENDDDTTSAS